jgi:hypothetical protein
MTTTKKESDQTGQAKCSEHSLVEEIRGYIHYIPERPNSNDSNCGSWVTIMGTGDMVQIDYCPFCGKALPLATVIKPPPG